MVSMSTTIRSCSRLIPLLAVLAAAASLVPMRKAMGAPLDPRLVKGAAPELGKFASPFEKKFDGVGDGLKKMKDGSELAYDVNERLQALTPGAGGNSPSGAVGYVIGIGNQKFSVSGIDIDNPVTRTGMCIGGARAVLLYQGKATLFLGDTLPLYACSPGGGASTGGAVLGLGRTGTPARTFGTFSYVLPYRYGDAVRVRLGVGKAQQGQGGRPTWLIANPVYPDRYYVQMTSVLVGDLPLQIPAGALDIRRDGTGGVYLSTTQPIGMVLNGEVYELLKTTLQYSLGTPDANSQWLCYYAGATKGLVLPTIKLVFANDAVMALPPRSSVWYPRNDGAHCLAVVRSPPTGETVLGTRVQMGRLMTYNLAADGVSGAVTFSA